MTTEELISNVRKLEIRSKHLSRQLFSGDYHSSFKGQGMSFADVRAYQYGDDVRHIDWNVTARANEPFIKQYDEERELVVMLLVDVSGSLATASEHHVLQDWATEIAAVLAFAASSNQDKVGLILFDEEVSLYLPPKKGRTHVLRILRELVNREIQSKATDVGEALRFLNRVQRRKCVAFVLSDFISPAFTTELNVTARQHDLIGLNVYHPWTRLDKGPKNLRVRDAESNRTTVISWAKTERDKVEAGFQTHQSANAALFAKAGVDLIDLPIGTSYVTRLHQFFKRRAVRR